MTPVIELTGISKSFPKTKRYRELLTRPFAHEYVKVLKNIDLTVEPGEIFGLAGANGAGKTTLLKIVGTLLLPSSGNARICGVDLVADNNRAKEKVGYMLASERGFFNRLSGRQNLEFFAALNNISTGRSKDLVQQTLKLVNLDEFGELEFMKYSSGMQQRLAIARALLHDPEVLILDEPTKSLDPISANDFKGLIGKLVKDKGKTVMIASHNLQEIEELCNRAAILERGEITFIGSPMSLRSKFKLISEELFVEELSGTAME